MNDGFYLSDEVISQIAERLFGPNSRYTKYVFDSAHKSAIFHCWDSIFPGVISTLARASRKANCFDVFREHRDSFLASHTKFELSKSSDDECYALSCLTLLVFEHLNQQVETVSQSPFGQTNG